MFGTFGLLRRTLRASQWRRVHRDVERRQPVLEDARDVALLHVRERREVAVGERQPVVVVANVERLAEALRQSLDEAELAAVGAAPNARRLEHDAPRLALRSFDFEDDLLAIGLPRLDRDFIVGGEKLPIEEVGNRAAIDAQNLRPRDNSKLRGDAIWLDPGDSYHNQINLEGWGPKSKQYNELRGSNWKIPEPRQPRASEFELSRLNCSLPVLVRQGDESPDSRQ